jgi:hypothetical protein
MPATKEMTNVTTEINEDERQRFLAWTWEKEQEAYARDEAQTLPDDFEFPTFLGHQMDWWCRMAGCFNLPRDPGLHPGRVPDRCILDYLGLTEAVQQWNEAEWRYRKEQKAIRRKMDKEDKLRREARSRTIAAILG